MPDRLVVMVSSTVRDLPNHRPEVCDACLSQGMLPRMMEEHLPASDAIALSLRMVDEADVYVGVFAYRYGYVPDGHDVSITEMEYNRAVERGIPRLIFLMHEDHPIKGSDVEKGAGAVKLEVLKERLGGERVVGFFRSPEDLRARVISSLVGLREQARPAPAGKRGKVFISYRREGGAETALFLREKLRQHGWDVFLDVVDLGVSYFDERLLRAIEAADAFVVILSGGALDRCGNSEDWLRREIRHALAQKKRIVPVIKDGFEFPRADSLPEDVRELTRHNAVPWSHYYFDQAVGRVVEFLSEKPRPA